jgi:hypothetical protein
MSSRRCLGRSGGTLLVLVIVILASAVLLFAWGQRHNEDKAARVRLLAQTDPAEAVRQFIISRERSPSSPGWDPLALLDVMSRDDMAWFEANKERLAVYQAGEAVTLEGADAIGRAAIRYLLGYGPPASSRPLLSTVEEHGQIAVVYIHEPNRPDTLKPLFLANEGGFWKLMRFAGERDEDRVIGRLAKAKGQLNQPLDADEHAWLRLGSQYAAAKRSELLARTGITAAP